MYKCSRHDRWLVDYVRLIRAARGQDTYLILPYYRCPEPGCDYIKPNKWRKVWPADQNEVTVLQLLKDGVPAELMPRLKLWVENNPPGNLKNPQYALNQFLEKCGRSHLLE